MKVYSRHLYRGGGPQCYRVRNTILPIGMGMNAEFNTMKCWWPDVTLCYDGNLIDTHISTHVFYVVPIEISHATTLHWAMSLAVVRTLSFQFT